LTNGTVLAGPSISYAVLHVLALSFLYFVVCKFVCHLKLSVALALIANNAPCDSIQMMHGSGLALKYDETEHHLISVSHERLCVICFVVWPTASLNLYVIF